MAKKVVNMKPCIEVAPPLVIFPTKLSHFPKLETIKEDDRVEGQNEDDKNTSF
uniref:DBP1-interacting protein 2 n=1 Tax=Nicotiana tabacum TaxID=4097 RepID=F8UX48_TOBAC|nr:DBP1-interacting protein 2 [Nicotiana tabacum]